MSDIEATKAMRLLIANDFNGIPQDILDQFIRRAFKKSEKTKSIREGLKYTKTVESIMSAGIRLEPFLLDCSESTIVEELIDYLDGDV